MSENNHEAEVTFHDQDGVTLRGPNMDFCDIEPIYEEHDSSKTNDLSIISVDPESDLSIDFECVTTETPSKRRKTEGPSYNNEHTKINPMSPFKSDLNDAFLNRRSLRLDLNSSVGELLDFSSENDSNRQSSVLTSEDERYMSTISVTSSDKLNRTTEPSVVNSESFLSDDHSSSWSSPHHSGISNNVQHDVIRNDVENVSAYETEEDSIIEDGHQESQRFDHSSHDTDSESEFDLDWDQDSEINGLFDNLENLINSSSIEEDEDETINYDLDLDWTLDDESETHWRLLQAEE